jgi:integrase
MYILIYQRSNIQETRLKKPVEGILGAEYGALPSFGAVKMGRHALHRIVTPHPSPRFKDSVRLFNFLRGPTDNGWAAQFRIDGKWLPRNPVALGTKDFAEACERARDRFTLASTGQPITVARASPALPKGRTHAFRLYADKAIAALRQQAIEADAAVKGKGHKFAGLASKIEKDLLPEWGDVPITAITEHDLNDWIADEYRVEDIATTVAKYGRQTRKAARQKVMKKPSVTTLGNLDWAFKAVWDVAVAARVVDRRNRPIINKTEHGEDGEARSFIDDAAVARLEQVMDRTWMVTANGHTTDYKLLLRAYIALAASTGIRPGLELQRVRLGNIQFHPQHQGISIQIEKNQGKHGKSRSVIVFEGGVFPIRGILQDLIAWQRERGAADTDYLFSWRDGTFPVFRPGLRHVMEAADCLTDPMSGKQRVMYSFRHYFATQLIERGLSVPQVAEWLGTSSDMVERHYNRFLIERNAPLFNGHELALQKKLKKLDYIDENGQPWHWDETTGEYEAG